MRAYELFVGKSSQKKQKKDAILTFQKMACSKKMECTKKHVFGMFQKMK